MKIDLEKQLREPIKNHIDNYDRLYRVTLNSEVKLINTIIGYITKQKGKQLRPSLCLLSASLCGEPNDQTYRAAALIEMIHVATLIHDDVVDGADIRRGWPSVNRIWKNKLSILVGDYMFSKALTNMINLKNFDALSILSNTAERLSQGEIFQIEKSIKKNINEEAYFKMVSDKTASLFSASCEIGAITVTDNKDHRRALFSFGEKFGLVFQIKDDLLDIMGNIKGLGKPAGFDLKRNMITLPLIYLFQNLSEYEAKKVKRKLNFHVKRSELSAIKKLIQDNGGIDLAEKKIQDLSDQAIKDLDVFEDTIYKTSLISALDFNYNRNK